MGVPLEAVKFIKCNYFSCMCRGQNLSCYNGHISLISFPLDKYNYLEFILCSSKHKRLSAFKRCEIHKKLSSFFFSIFVNAFEGFVFILEFKSYNTSSEVLAAYCSRFFFFHLPGSSYCLKAFKTNCNIFCSCKWKKKLCNFEGKHTILHLNSQYFEDTLWYFDMPLYRMPLLQRMKYGLLRTHL